MDQLSEIFDVDAIEIESPIKSNTVSTILTPQNSKTTNQIATTQSEKDLIEDLKTARDDFDTIIDLGKSALEQVIAIADEGQHPRFYEAAGAIIKSLSDANKERFELHLKLSQIRKNQAESGNKTVNIDKAAIFTGTTNDLLALINPRKSANTTK